MPSKTVTRKKRVDRMHIIYLLSINGLEYVGLTAKTESTINKSLVSRVNKHWYRSKKENKDWLLCQALRELSVRAEIDIKVLTIVRGKAEGHIEEVRLRREIGPALNTDCRGD